MRIISPSILSADFMNLKKNILKIEKAGVRRLHLDVMDGNFVDQLTFGPMIIKSIKRISQSHLETHLMIKDPMKTVNQYIDAGSDTVIIHYEASNNHIENLKYIQSKNVLSGIALNPNTDFKKIIPLLDYLDYILIMSVYPGKGGQEFINETKEKMKSIVSICNGYNITIGVDGGVKLHNIKEIYDTGINVAIVGSELFGASDIVEMYNKLNNE